MVLQICDDGIGFPLDTQHDGEGIENLKRRAKSIDGKVVFHAKSGEGTKVEIHVPLKTRHQMNGGGLVSRWRPSK